MFRIFLTLIIILVLFNSAISAEKVVYIKNKSVKIGLLPDVGGRLVYLSTVDGANILLSDSILWNEPSENRITPSIKSGFKPYNGMIPWLGPQSQWWSQQDLIPEKQGEYWPPDPFLIYSVFEVSGRTDSSIVLTSPESPITGVKLVKYFNLSGNKVEIKVTAQNIRPSVVAWDIWSNARFDAFSKFRIPVDSSGILKIQYQDENISEPIIHQLIDGYFSFQPELPSNPQKRKIAKAFIYPTEGKMMGYKNNCQLTIEFDKVPFEQIHPEQALIEVYNCVSRDGLSNI